MIVLLRQVHDPTLTFFSRQSFNSHLKSVNVTAVSGKHPIWEYQYSVYAGFQLRRLHIVNTLPTTLPTTLPVTSVFPKSIPNTLHPDDRFRQIFPSTSSFPAQDVSSLQPFRAHPGHPSPTLPHLLWTSHTQLEIQTLPATQTRQLLVVVVVLNENVACYLSTCLVCSYSP
jgi:hypothetical protein